MGLLGHLRGDGQRPRRRSGLHGRLEHPADQAPRLHLRGAVERDLRRRADHRRGSLPTRGRRLRPGGRDPLPDRGQLRLPVRLLPLPPALEPDGHRPPRGRRPAPDAQGRRRRQRPSRGGPGGRDDLPDRVGRHRRPEPVVPVHAGRHRADVERHRAPVRQPARGAPRAPRASPGSRARSTTTAA